MGLEQPPRAEQSLPQLRTCGHLEKQRLGDTLDSIALAVICNDTRGTPGVSLWHLLLTSRTPSGKAARRTILTFSTAEGI